MKTYDFENLEPEEEVKLDTNNESNQENYDFEGVIDYDALFMYHIINKCYSMKSLLEEAGIDTSGTNMYCPFHDDVLTGKKSAKFFREDDSLYCFSENRVYTAYHALRYLYGANMKKVFLKAWGGLSDPEKEQLMHEYGGDSEVLKTDFISPVWRQCIIILGKFRKGEVTLHQHRNALYKVLKMIHDDNTEKRLRY